MESLKIVALCMASAIVYGICHDNVTVRVCLEYFTVGHPPILGGTKNPTLLAFGWGVFATWWVGLGLGVPAAFLSRIGSRPKLTSRDLRRPLIALMILIGIASVGNGIAGAWLADFNAYYHPSNRIESSRGYVVAAHAHGAAYLVGVVGGILILGWIWWRRGRDYRRELHAELERLRRENAELMQSLSS